MSVAQEYHDLVSEADDLDRSAERHRRHGRVEVAQQHEDAAADVRARASVLRVAAEAEDRVARIVRLTEELNALDPTDRHAVLEGLTFGDLEAFVDAEVTTPPPAESALVPDEIVTVPPADADTNDQAPGVPSADPEPVVSPPGEDAGEGSDHPDPEPAIDDEDDDEQDGDEA